VRLRSTNDAPVPPDRFEAVEATRDPTKLAEWVDFHETIDTLPEPEREVFDLLWYHGLSQDEAAGVLEVDVRTVKRRWRAAGLSLHATLGGELPGG
jgi:DNA-directed RNA polymerase specialized sigma24 family protein